MLKPVSNYNTAALALLLISAVSACWVFPGNARADTALNGKEKPTGPSWSDAETRLLVSLSLSSLGDLPPDPSNRVADDTRAAALGRKLFFDPRLSANGDISCASCHIPERYFTDGLAQARGIGTNPRSTPTLLGSAYSAWYFWDGRRDSQWAQALGPLESGIEHGITRNEVARFIVENPDYKADYEAIFGTLPDLSDTARFPPEAGPSSDRKILDSWWAMSDADRSQVTRIFVNTGKAIAAYERQLLPGPGRFDSYVTALQAGDSTLMEERMNADEVAGLKLFIGKAMCIRCHNGPLLTDHNFHNIGIPFAEGLNRDWGRYQGVQKALKDEFNCLSEYSDAKPDDCAELRFAKTVRDETIGAFKAPSLRNVAETAPYMHSGQFADLDAVLEHYNSATRSRKAPVGHSDLLPINLTKTELSQLKAFLHTLSGPAPIDAALMQSAETGDR